MDIFKKDPIKRLNEDELREKYLDSKKLEKISSIFYMVGSGLLSIIIIAFSISKSITWGYGVASIFVILWIYNTVRFSRILEDIFENKIIEEESHD